MGDSRINVQIESGNEVISILPHTDTSQTALLQGRIQHYRKPLKQNRETKAKRNANDCKR